MRFRSCVLELVTLSTTPNHMQPMLSLVADMVMCLNPSGTIACRTSRRLRQQAPRYRASDCHLRLPLLRSGGIARLERGTFAEWHRVTSVLLARRSALAAPTAQAIFAIAIKPKIGANAVVRAARAPFQARKGFGRQLPARTFSRHVRRGTHLRHRRGRRRRSGTTLVEECEVRGADDPGDNTAAPCYRGPPSGILGMAYQISERPPSSSGSDFLVFLAGGLRPRHRFPLAPIDHFVQTAQNESRSQ